MTQPEAALFVFDGYRGANDVGQNAAASLSRLLGASVAVCWNKWLGSGESLSDRFLRATAWLEERSSHISQISAIGLSMGCQVAVRFSQQMSARYPPLCLDKLVLVAPDPKYRPVGRDVEEASAGISSAFDEAVGLWGSEGAAGPQFVSALADLTGHFADIRIIYCRSDGVTEWKNNVDLMIQELNLREGVDAIEATDGELLEGSDTTVDLRSVNLESDVHERLWSSVSF